jgi:hypothetical protein
MAKRSFGAGGEAQLAVCVIGIASTFNAAAVLPAVTERNAWRD